MDKEELIDVIEEILEDLHAALPELDETELSTIHRLLQDFPEWVKGCVEFKQK